MSQPAVNRRSFLASSAALAVAGPTILGRRVWAQDVDLRIGFIGVGGMGGSHLRNLARYCSAVCDVDTKRLAAAQKLVRDQTTREVPGFGDYRRLLESPDVDAVLVATPDHWHTLVSIHACEAGKDVYCEKPLTLCVREGRALVNAARRYDRIVQTGSQQRSDGKFRLACELVRSGRLGKVHTVKVGIPGVNFKGPSVPCSAPPPELDYEFWLGPAPWRPYNEKQVHYNFRFFWAYSGGQMTNWGAHHLDIAQWGLGADEAGPLAVSGTAEYQKDGWYEVPERFECTYEYPNGVTVLAGSRQPDGTTFVGTEGTIHVNRGVLESTPAGIIKEPLQPSDIHLYESQNHGNNWMECIRTRRKPICDVEIGHRSATVCHLGMIAVRAGRRIVWDAAAEAIVDDPYAAALLGYPYRSPLVLPD